MQRAFFQVNGNADETNSAALVNALESIPGVCRADIDTENHSVTVNYNEPANTDSIAGCIGDHGFTVYG
jgi:copper chaperone CopZ